MTLLTARLISIMVPAWLAAAAPAWPQISRIAGSTDSVVIEFDVRVPMRDGVTLAADVYRPIRPGRYPVILTRTPYTKTGDYILREARAFAGRGVVYVAMDVRGRGNSDGDWRPYRDEG